MGCPWTDISWTELLPAIVANRGNLGVPETFLRHCPPFPFSLLWKSWRRRLIVSSGAHAVSVATGGFQDERPLRELEHWGRGISLRMSSGVGTLPSRRERCWTDRAVFLSSYFSRALFLNLAIEKGRLSVTVAGSSDSGICCSVRTHDPQTLVPWCFSASDSWANIC